MNEKEILDVIFFLGDSVWKNWGFIITVNIAVIGWLLQRHGLYSLSEKIIATLGYTVFSFMMLGGMINAYGKLDVAANELAYRYLKIDKTKYSPEGIVEYYVSKSQKYCADAKKNHPDIKECNKYSDNLLMTYISLFTSWIFIIPLFWSEKIWLKARKNSKKN